MKIWIVSFFLLLYVPLLSQTLLEQRKCDWELAGLQKPLNFSNQYSITDFGAIANDEISDDQAFNAAFLYLENQSGTITIPQGTFILGHSIVIPDSIIIQGSGVDNTTLEFRHDEIGIQVVGHSENHFVNIRKAIKGSDFIICDSASFFYIGDFIELMQNNGVWDSQPASWAENSIGQINEVILSKNDTLFLRDPLTYSCDSLLQPRIRKIIPKKNIGIECIKFIRKSNNIEGSAYGILFQYSSNCEIKSIESDTSEASHIMINASSHIYVHASYFHHAKDYSGSATRGYGITLNNHACYCLVENNIFNHLRHSMMTKNGANANVFSYNYSTNPYRNGENEFPSDFCGDISLHGHYSFGNLFEGNIVQNIIIDDYWGPSGDFNTFFRNRIEKYGFIMTSAETNNTNIIANEICGIGYSFPFNLGMFILSGDNNLNIGNCIQGSFSSDTSQIAAISSFYRTATPHFWDYGTSWPATGYPQTTGSLSIPAQARFEMGQPVVCTDTTWIQSILDNTIKCKIFPNPTTAIITVESKETIETIVLQCMDGRTIKEFLVPQLLTYQIDLSIIPSGTYLLLINNTISYKIGVYH